MADTYTSLLRLRLQETGANDNVWGGYLNTAAIQLIEDAIAGMATITVAASDVTLSSNNGATDQSRMAILDLEGTPSAARNIIVPQKTKIFVVINNTDSTMTIKTSAVGATTVAVATGVTTIMICDGTNMIELAPQSVASALNSAALGGVAAANWARLNASQNFSKAQRKLAVGLTMGATVTPDFDLGNIFTGQLDQNTTIDQPDNISASGAQQFEMILQQATSGGPYTTTFDTFFRFINDTPTMPTTAENLLYIRGVVLPDLGEAVCFWSRETGSTVSDITLDKNENNVDIFRRAGSPAGIVDITVTIEEGVVIGTNSPAEPALNFNGFLSGSTINLINYGYVVGGGGDGDDAAYSADLGGGFKFTVDSHSTARKAGGNAINGPGAGCTLNITNGSGRIWGGGGGGGHGSASSNSTSNPAIGGAGGGGAGFGKGGKGAYLMAVGVGNSITGGEAANGRMLLDGTDSGGTGGTAQTNGSSGAGNGGDGGDFGADGTAGSTGTTTDADNVVAASAGGTAGKAVEPNGATVNFVSGSGSPNVKGAVV